MAKAPTIVAGPASSNDSYSIGEDQAAAGTVKFNVRVNDNSKSTLYSLDDGQSADLLTQDGVLVPQSSRLGATIAITADGQVSYTNNSAAVQALGPGQTLQDSFLYAVRLQNGSLVWQTVTVTITGTNDAPVAVADVAAAAEDSVTTGSVAGNDRDIDNGAVLTFATTDQIPAGFSMAGNGSWAFDGSHAAYQSLAAGETRQFVIQYWVTDQFGASSSSTLTLTVTGRNDAPAAVSAQASAGEDQVVGGQLSATDVDQASGLTFALNEAAPAGFTLNADGSWSFDAGSYDALGEGETQTILVRYAAVDSAGARGNAILTITLTGTNDGPVAAAATATVAEDSLVSGTVAASDPDASASLVYEPYYGGPDGFAMAADGSWTFDADQPAYQALGEGESQEVAIDYVVTDDQGATSIATLTITVTGTNDGPSASPATASVAEDGLVSGQVLVSDPDANDSLTVEPPMTHYIPGLEMLSDGSWSFDANQYEYQALAEGETRQLVIDYSVADIASAYAYSTLTITITGANDPPVTTSQWIEAAENLAATGGLLAFDQDNGAVLTFAVDGEAPGGFVLDPTGAWYFDGSNAAYDHLSYGEVELIQVPFTVTDEFGGSISSFVMLAVSGRNDVATIGGVQGGTVTEAVRGAPGSPGAQGQLTIADPDSPAQFQPVAEPSPSLGGYGRFTLTGDGAWAYELDNGHAAVEALDAGQTLEDYFTVHSADGSSSVVTILIQGGTDWALPAVYAGTGDPMDYDTLLGAAGTDNFNATVTGTEARDVVTGGSLAQSFDMLGGDDTVYGRGGNDLVLGGAGFDNLYGQAGSDTLDGGASNDTIHGGTGNDELLGGAGMDTLRGGSGADTIHGGLDMDFVIGGFGADLLTGGAERDAFIFNDLRDSGDTVTDYVFGLDTLDFRALDANASLDGDQAFAFSRTGPAANALWMVQNGADLELFMDTDGDPRTAEFMVTLAGVTYTPPPEYLPPEIAW